jgi:hypothetical protein
MWKEFKSLSLQEVHIHLCIVWFQIEESEYKHGG